MELERQMQGALTAAANRNIEPLIALMDSTMEWRGISSGHLWWRNTPA
jgi:hypothetical protein